MEKVRIFFIWILITQGLVTSQAYGQAQIKTGPETFLVEQAEVKFFSFHDDKIFVSSHCVLKNLLSTCEASKKLKIISLKAIHKEPYQNSSPGVFICEQQLGGRVVIGTNKQTNDEMSFCKLSDGSMVDNGTLSFFGRQNDQEKKDNSVDKSLIKKNQRPK